jgi:hypothetical protein
MFDFQASNFFVLMLYDIYGSLFGAGRIKLPKSSATFSGENNFAGKRHCGV